MRGTDHLRGAAADAADLDEPPAGQKRCVQCLEVKSQDEFCVNAACAAEGGWGSFCRPCWQIRFNARSRNMTLDDVRALVAAAAPAEAADVAERERECRFCAQLKPLNDFNRKKAHVRVHVLLFAATFVPCKLLA